MEKDGIFTAPKRRVKFLRKLGTRSFLLTALFGLLLGGGAILLGYSIYSNNADEFYSSSAIRIGSCVADQVDKESAKTLRDAVMLLYYDNIDYDMKDDDEIYDMYQEIKKKGDALVMSSYLDCFEDVEETLREFRDATPENDYIYYVDYDPEQDNIVFIADIRDNTKYKDKDYFCPGSVWELEDKAFELMTSKEGKGYTVYSIGGGMVVTKLCEVVSEDGEELGYIGVDTFLSDVVSNKHRFLLFFFIFIGILDLLLSYVMMMILKHSIVRPVEKLEQGGHEFINRLGTEITSAPHYFANLGLYTGDEIENLWLTMADLEINIAVSMKTIKKMTSEKERAEAELALANQIQRSMLPSVFPAFPDRNEFDLYADMVPAKNVGGDLYDFFLIDDDHLALVIGDVSGKGITAALFMVMAKHLIKSQTMADGADPEKIFTAVNQMLMEENEAMLFVTAFLGILTLSTGHMVSATAGHEYPAVRRKDGLFYYEQDAHAMPLAIRKKNKFVEHELTLQPGDTLYLFTDGITEASDKDEEMFQKERLLEVLNENPDAEPRELDILVRQRISEFVADAEQFDDMTTLCLKYYGPQVDLGDGSEGSQL